MALTADIFNLERFIAAQDPVYGRVVQELRHGSKQSHWMWFIFPQIAGLGRSATAERYAITGLDEARAYIAHPLLGGRLRECITLVLAVTGRTAAQIFGDPDDLKFHSCLTLFAHAAPGEALFREALETYYAGEEDSGTLGKL
ncbi:MAG TPA: DUF1810 domain-containing protein [Rhizomicrobium sp.]|jgi:uncharacterized protein (DUF1810 family)